MNINFNSFFGKYKNLDEKGIELLNTFFNSPETTKTLEEIEINRKKRLKILIGILALLFLLLMIIFPPKLTAEYFTVALIIGIASFPFVGAIGGGVVKYFWGNDAKTDLIPAFVKTVEPQMTYRKTPDSGIWNIDFLDAGVKTGVIRSYQRVDKFEDTISYDILSQAGEKVINLRAVEVKTSVLRRTKKRTYRQVNNHAYLMKVKFSNPTLLIKKPISLKQDVNEHGRKKWLTSFFGTILGIFVLLMLVSPRKLGAKNNEVDINAYISSLGDVGKTLWILGSIALFAGIFFTFHYFTNRKRVKMENVEFEQRFDVYCEDPEQTRQLLTPSFMYRILDYIEKIDSKRVYTFYFDQDYFFVKYDILASGRGNYMEVSSFRKVTDSLDDFVKFYLEIKGIKTLIEDLKLLYYSASSRSTQVIK